MAGKPTYRELEQRIKELEKRRAEENPAGEQPPYLHSLESMERINEVIRETTDIEQMMSGVLETVLSILHCDRAWLIFPCDPDAPTWSVPMERTRPEYPGSFSLGKEIDTTTEMAEQFRVALESKGPVVFDPSSGRPLPDPDQRPSTRSAILMTLYPKTGKPWLWGLTQCSHPRIWTEEDRRLFSEISLRLTDALSSLLFLRILRESEEKYRLLVESAGEGIVLSEGGKFKYVNPRALEFVGYSQEDFMALSMFEFVHPDDRERLAQLYLKKLAGEDVPEASSWRVIDKSGTVKWVQSRSTVLTWEGRTSLLTFLVDITQQRQTEEALRESEAHYRSFWENTGTATVIIEKDTTISMVNAEFEKLSGLPREEIEGKKSWTEFVVPQDLEEMRGYHSARRKAGGEAPRSYEFGFVDKAGNVKHVVNTVAMIPGTTQSLSSLIDISARKVMEQELRKGEELYTKLIAAIPDFVVRTDMGGNILFINDRALEVSGYSRPAVEGRNMLDFVAPEDRERVVANTMKMLERRLGPQEYRLVMKDGRKVPFEVNGDVLRGEDGTEFGLVNVCRDITERKRTEEELRLNERRTAALLELSQMTDKPDNVITDFALERAVEITGSRIGYLAFLKKDETVLTMYSWSHNAMKECMVQNKPIVYPVADKGLWGEAVRQRRPIITNDYLAPNPYKKGYPDGHVDVVRHMNVPIFDAGRIVLVAGVGNKPGLYDEADVQQLTLLMDGLWKVIKAKRAEEEKEKLQAQLLQAQKMESVGRLAGGVAHDFNNMLGAIIGNAELAKMQIDPADPLSKNIQEILRASSRSADLVRQLLAFARKQTVSPKVLDLNDTVEGMLRMLRRLIGENIDLAWMPGRDLWPVMIDPSQIDQILANLAVNARDAIASVGKVTIESKNVTIDEDYCAEHAGFEPGRYVLVAVSDDGVGMRKDVLENIFEPFFTTKETGKGTGLGLATVYGIVKQNNGFINVYSEPGKGTTFRIYLPGFEGEVATAPEVADSKELPKGTETVLLAEDEGLVREIAKDLLERQGYTVLAARTPTEALMLAEKHPGDIHLLLTDVVMPEMNGRELMEKLHAVRPGVKGLFMSGYTANVVVHHGVLDEEVYFIEKPFSPKALAEKVRDVLDRG